MQIRLWLSQTWSKLGKLRWLLLGSIAVVIICMIGFSLWHKDNTNVSDQSDSNQPILITSNDVLEGIYIDNKAYIPEETLSKTATEENIGNFVGYVTFPGKTASEICAFQYLPDDGKTNKVIVFDKNTYTVYSFYCYEPDGTEAWPISLFHNTSYVEIRDPNYDISNEAVYHTLSDEKEVQNILMLLSSLGEKHNQAELNQRYFSLFQNRFTDKELWMGEDNTICHANPSVSVRFTQLICGKSRIIAVVMKDNTVLLYEYLQGAGVLL